MPKGNKEGPSPDELRRRAMAVHDRRVIHLDTVAKDIIRLLAEAVDRVKHQMMSGMGYKAEELRPEDARALKELVVAFNSATDAQTRLDKTAEIRKNTMSHEEQKTALAEWVLSWASNSERADWIRDLARAHDAQRAQQVGLKKMSPNASLELGPVLAGVREDGTGEPDGHAES